MNLNHNPLDAVSPLLELIHGIGMLQAVKPSSLNLMNEKNIFHQPQTTRLISPSVNLNPIEKAIIATALRHFSNSIEEGLVEIDDVNLPDEKKVKEISDGLADWLSRNV